MEMRVAEVKHIGKPEFLEDYNTVIFIQNITLLSFPGRILDFSLVCASEAAVRTRLRRCHLSGVQQLARSVVEEVSNSFCRRFCAGSSQIHSKGYC